MTGFNPEIILTLALDVIDKILSFNAAYNRMGRDQIPAIEHANIKAAKQAKTALFEARDRLANTLLEQGMEFNKDIQFELADRQQLITIYFHQLQDGKPAVLVSAKAIYP